MENNEEAGGGLISCHSCGNKCWTQWLTAPDRFHGRRQLYTLVQCSACRLVWLVNAPTPAEMGQHYGTHYDNAIGGAGDRLEHWLSRRNVLLRQKPSGRILDLGCSSGGFLASLQNHDWKLHGIEMSPAAARYASRRSGAEVFVGDVLDAPFAANTFDAITCFHVFEHLYDPRAVLTKITEWLKPNGVFYTMMPNIESAGARVFRSYWYALELPRHLYHFSPRSLAHLASSVGLDEVSITTHRELFIEPSTRYLLDELFRKCGISRVPLAEAPLPSVPWRILRKTLRITLLPLLSQLVGFAGPGESIHAIFRKPPQGSVASY